MKGKREITKDLLTASFIELMKKIPFEKITIKMITDDAGVMRPTFYKHFQDKYEVLEWILQKNIVDKVQFLIDNNLEEDIFKLLCHCLDKERLLYKKLYAIEGPNSFETLMYHFIMDLFTFLLNKYPLKAPDKLKILSNDAVARFYTFGLTESLKYWITHDQTYSPDQMCDAYEYIIRNSILDLIEFKNR